MAVADNQSLIEALMGPQRYQNALSGDEPPVNPHGRGGFPNLDPRAYMGTGRGEAPSFASQVPWALMGLRAASPRQAPAAPEGMPTPANRQQAFQNLDKMDTDLAHLGAAKNALGKSGVSDAMAAMTARQRQGFMESLSPMEKLQYYYSWTPKGLPESPLFSPGFWAAVTGIAGPQAYFLYDSLRSNAEERQRRPLSVLPDAPY